jgi:hypothetical protein
MHGKLIISIWQLSLLNTVSLFSALRLALEIRTSVIDQAFLHTCVLELHYLTRVFKIFLMK